MSDPKSIARRMFRTRPQQHPDPSERMRLAVTDAIAQAVAEATSRAVADPCKVRPLGPKAPGPAGDGLPQRIRRR